MASGQPPSFYHVLMNPSSPHLPLPLKFVKKHLKNRALKKPILKSANGGYLWKLKMKKLDDHTFCFVNGWCNVVKDLGLLFGEFLLFKYVGSGVFIMHVYSVNGCEKILVPRIHNDFKVVVDDEVSVFDDDDDLEDEVEEDDDDYNDVEYDVEEDDEDVEEDDDVDVELGDDSEDGNDDEDEDNVDFDGHDGDPFFVITSSKRNTKKLRFPPDLVAMAKIKTKETITLKNNDGYEKEMPVRSYKQNKSARYYVAEGWEEFQRSNNISEGDECVLKFITNEDKLCLAKVTKKKPRATEVDIDDMDDDDGMDEEAEAEDDKEDYSNVGGDDIFDDDEGKGENAKHVNDDEDDEDDDRDVDGGDGDPSFILTSSDKNQYHLWFKADFVALAGINTKKTITLKNLDGYEKKLRVQSRKWQSQSKCNNYYLAAGWKEFQRISNISEGDKFVFKFIASEDKFCVAKITKKRTPARPLLPDAEAPVTEVVDGMDDQDVDDNDDMDDDDGMDNEGGHHDVDGDDGDPSFILTSSDKNQYKLWFKANFVALAGIDTKETITLKNLDGYEKELHVRSHSVQYTRSRSERYYLAAGWKEFQRNSNISEGDQILFRFIASEDKFCVAKITKKNNRARPLPPAAAEAPGTKVDDGMDDQEVDDNDDMDDDDGMDKEGEAEDAKEDDSNVDGDDVFDDEGKGDNAKLVTDDRDVDGDDVDPSLILTSSNKNKYTLRFPADFAALAGINTKKTITLKNLDGYEKELHVRSHVESQRKYYCLGSGWKEFQRKSNISEGDKFVFKFITSEDKLCVAKITKINFELFDDGNPSFVATITSTYKLWMPADFAWLARLDTKKTLTLKSLDGYEKEMPLRVRKRKSKPARYYVGSEWKDILQSTSILEGDKCVFKYIASKDKLCLAKIITKKAQEMTFNDDDMEDDNDKDENEDPKHVNDVDPFFVVDITTSHKFMLRLPPDFVELAGIDGKKNIIIKCLDGNEIEIVLRQVKQGHSTRYCLSMGWPAFKRSNNISEGDKCVFKYITSEDKLCLATVTKTSATKADVDPFFVVTITPSRKSSLWLPVDFMELAGIDTKKYIIVKSLDGNETRMALRSCLSKKGQRFSLGWRAFKRSNNILEGDECVFKYITSEDKMCLAKVTKEKTQTSLPSPSPAQVVKRKRGRSPPAAEIKMPAAENVKRSRQPPPVEITVAEAVKTEEEERAASAIVTTSD